MLTLRCDFVDFAVIARSNVEVSTLVESKVPYIFRARGKVLRGTPRGIQRRLRIFLRVIGGLLVRLFLRLSGLVLDLVHLAIGSRRGIDHTTGANSQRLHL